MKPPIPTDPNDTFSTYGFGSHLENVKDKMKKLTDEFLRQQQKLVLVLDIDHTLLHTTKNSHASIAFKKKELSQDIFMINLYTSADSSEVAYFVKLRPGLDEFLQILSKAFCIVLYTKGLRLYAKKILAIIDPDDSLIEQRIVCREDQSNINDLKTIRSLFPCNEKSVLIVDDRENIWENKRNVYQCHKFHFWPIDHATTDNPDPILDEYIQKQNEMLSLGEKPLDEKFSLELLTLRNKDNVLKTISIVLLTVHALFYKTPEFTDIFPSTPLPADTRVILSKLRKNVLRGIKIVFSGMFPLSVDPREQFIWRLAESFGAICSEKIDASVTHLVARNTTTEKANVADSLKSVSVVSSAWLFDCVTHFRLVSEKRFLLSKASCEKFVRPYIKNCVTIRSLIASLNSKKKQPNYREFLERTISPLNNIVPLSSVVPLPIPQTSTSRAQNETPSSHTRTSSKEYAFSSSTIVSEKPIETVIPFQNEFLNPISSKSKPRFQKPNSLDRENFKTENLSMEALNSNKDFRKAEQRKEPSKKVNDVRFAQTNEKSPPKIKVRSDNFDEIKADRQIQRIEIPELNQPYETTSEKQNNAIDDNYSRHKQTKAQMSSQTNKPKDKQNKPSNKETTQSNKQTIFKPNRAEMLKNKRPTHVPHKVPKQHHKPESHLPKYLFRKQTKTPHPDWKESTLNEKNKSVFEHRQTTGKEKEATSVKALESQTRTKVETVRQTNSIAIAKKDASRALHPKAFRPKIESQKKQPLGSRDQASYFVPSVQTTNNSEYAKATQRQTRSEPQRTSASEHVFFQQQPLADLHTHQDLSTFHHVGPCEVDPNNFKNFENFEPALRQGYRHHLEDLPQQSQILTPANSQVQRQSQSQSQYSAQHSGGQRHTFFSKQVPNQKAEGSLTQKSSKKKTSSRFRQAAFEKFRKFERKHGVEKVNENKGHAHEGRFSQRKEKKTHFVSPQKKLEHQAPKPQLKQTRSEEPKSDTKSKKSKGFVESEQVVDIFDESYSGATSRKTPNLFSLQSYSRWNPPFSNSGHGTDPRVSPPKVQSNKPDRSKSSGEINKKMTPTRFSADLSRKPALQNHSRQVAAPVQEPQRFLQQTLQRLETQRPHSINKGVPNQGVHSVGLSNQTNQTFRYDNPPKAHAEFRYFDAIASSEQARSTFFNPHNEHRYNTETLDPRLERGNRFALERENYSHPISADQITNFMRHQGKTTIMTPRPRFGAEKISQAVTALGPENYSSVYNSFVADRREETIFFTKSPHDDRTCDQSHGIDKAPTGKIKQTAHSEQTSKIESGEARPPDEADASPWKTTQHNAASKRKGVDWQIDDMKSRFGKKAEPRGFDNLLSNYLGGIDGYDGEKNEKNTDQKQAFNEKNCC